MEISVQSQAHQTDYFPRVSYGGKLFPKAKQLLQSKSPSERELKMALEESQSPEEWIGFCFALESRSKSEALEKAWETGLRKFKNSPIYLESIGFFYYRNRLHQKATEMLKKANGMVRSLSALKLRLAAEYGQARHAEVLSLYKSFTPVEQKGLEDDLIAKVAASALHLGEFELSKLLFEFIRERRNLPELPTLEESLMNRFQSKKMMGEWVREMHQKFRSKTERNKVPTYEWVTYASALMFEKNYDEALSLLLQIKDERYAS